MHELPALTTSTLQKLPVRPLNAPSAAQASICPLSSTVLPVLTPSVYSSSRSSPPATPRFESQMFEPALLTPQPYAMFESYEAITSPAARTRSAFRRLGIGGRFFVVTAVP